ncbi:MAG: threonine/serine exporter family protein [Fusobacteriaceae bacterium]|jgi:uncharacterized membrane protein YjjP (DUF1212 family)|nr:threonine/serine exporter family protein [Fusobacteriaceae bacterium]
MEKDINMIQKDISNAKNVLYISCAMGRMILQNGGETYRTEETIVKTCAHYNLKASSFATLNTIITSIDPFENESEAGNYTFVDRINFRTINLKKVHMLNDLARNLDKYTIDELKEEIKRIDNENKISIGKKIFGHMMAGGSFAFLFGGNYKDGIVAVIAMLFLALMDKYFRYKKLNGFFTNLVGGMLSTTISLLFYKVGFIDEFSVSIIAALMLLAPGIAFTNSIRDVISGDFISGLSRGVEALVTGVSLAAGSGMILSVFL